MALVFSVAMMIIFINTLVLEGSGVHGCFIDVLVAEVFGVQN